MRPHVQQHKMQGWKPYLCWVCFDYCKPLGNQFTIYVFQFTLWHVNDLHTRERSPHCVHLVYVHAWQTNDIPFLVTNGFLQPWWHYNTYSSSTHSPSDICSRLTASADPSLLCASPLLGLMFTTKLIYNTVCVRTYIRRSYVACTWTGSRHYLEHQTLNMASSPLQAVCLLGKT